MALVDLADGSLVMEIVPAELMLEPDVEDSALEAASKLRGPVAVNFPSFSDGRGMTLARLLRERHGYAGELRAVGTLIPDLAIFLFRSGFDTAELTDPAETEVWKGSITRYRHAYQASSRNPYVLRHGPARASEGSGETAFRSDVPLAKSGEQTAYELDAELSQTRDIAERLQILARAVDGRIAFSTSLGIEDQAILNGISEARLNEARIDIFTLDTGRLFPEVLDTLEASEIRYGLRIRAVVPEASEVEELVSRDGVLGFRRSIENRKSCCEIRKVRPLNKALAGAAAWITGIRREQSGNRARMPLAEWDEAHALIKVNPLADWTAEDLDDYIAEYNVPVNALHARGFPSIGCQPCTRAIQPGEDPRAGRWWWENEDKKECGLHMRPQREAVQLLPLKESQSAKEGHAVTEGQVVTGGQVVTEGQAA